MTDEIDYVQAWTDISEELLLATETQNRDVTNAILLALDAASEEASRLADDADHQDDSFDPAWCKDAVTAYRRIRPATSLEVIADDKLLDRLGSATPGEPASDLDAALLAARNRVEATPIPPLVDTDTAIATIQAGAA